MRDLQGNRDVMVIGLGAVGLGYDLLKKDGGTVLTHCKAFSHSDYFKLEAGVDTCEARRQLFEDTYALPVYSDLGAALHSSNAGIVVVSSVTTSHLEIVERLAAQEHVHTILCEKPMGKNVRDAMEITNLCVQSKKNLYVNYFRNCARGTVELRKHIERIGRNSIKKGVVWYSKGLRHSASHLIALLISLLGEISDWQVLIEGQVTKEGDSCPDVEISFGTTLVRLVSIDETEYFYNGFVLFAETARIRYEHGGESIHIDYLTEDSRFSGYKRLSKKAVTIDGHFDQIQMDVATALQEQLEYGRSSLVTGSQAAEIQRVISSILEK